MTGSAGGAVPQVRALICPNCGGTVNLRGYAQTLNAVCGNCNTILDTRTPTVTILQTFQTKQRIQPLIPLGSRGKLDGAEYEVIGFQARETASDGITYQWREYLLYNPYRGYRYLTEYDGHWNDAKTIPMLPEFGKSGRKEAASVNGKLFTHFQTAEAQTVYVLGEFPWQVRVGEKVTAKDYINPPEMLSAEITEGEVVWTVAEYTDGKALWSGFKLAGQPPQPQGIYANQPSPSKGRIASVWGMFFKLTVLLFAVMLVLLAIERNEVVFQQNYTFTSHAQGEPSFVTPVFELKGRTAAVQVKIDTDLDNNWAHFNFALINEETGNAYDFGREVSYYAGRDSDGSWTEGSRSGSVTIPGVPAGRYYLRVEPEMDENSPSMRYASQAMSYTLSVKHGAPNMIWFVIAFFLLLIPPIVVTARTIGFENKRWAESDYGSPLASLSSGGNDD